MSNAPIPSHGVMEANGAYNQHAKLPASGAALALPLLAQAVQSVELDEEGQPIVIADYGSSQGKNSVIPMQLAIRGLRRRIGPNRAIFVFHIDQPSNDFAILFSVLDSDPDSYLVGDPNVFPAAIGRSFYKSVLPPGSVHLGWSSYAAVWLSQIPTLIPGHFFPAHTTGRVRAEFDRQAAKDWESFLSLRAKELRPGGRLVVVLPALRRPTGAAPQAASGKPTGSDPLVRASHCSRQSRAGLKMNTKRYCLDVAISSICLLAFVLASSLNVHAADEVSPAEARAIAQEAYIYGFPMVDGYRIQYAYFVDRNNPEFKAPWNQIRNVARVFTPDDKVVQIPNSDTPYSTLGLDLRVEPMVITVPLIEKSRYFSVQLIDLYTFNFGYIGSRTTGNDGASFMVAGPGWKGTRPPDIKKVFRCETDFALAGFRTQLFNPGDLDNVKKVQAGYKAQPLSQFLGQPTPPAAPAVEFIRPLTPDQECTLPEFFNILNFVLEFCPTNPSERELMARFAKLNIGAGKNFDAAKLSPEMKKAVQDGMADAWRAFTEAKKQVDAGKVTAADFLGAREYLKNNYMYRMLAAVLIIYGNSKQEAMYPVYTVDESGQALDATQNRYTLRFAPGQSPPVSAFWSLTMYELPSRLLVTNPLNRYLINSPMLPDLKRDADGGLTLYIQHYSPGKDKESNWLPAPSGPFLMFFRLFWPKPDALNGKWKQPPLQRAE